MIAAVTLLGNAHTSLANAHNSAVPTVLAGVKSKSTEQVETDLLKRMYKPLQGLVLNEYQ